MARSVKILFFPSLIGCMLRACSFGFFFVNEVYSLYSSKTLDKFCKVLYNPVISQIQCFIFVTIGTKLSRSLELHPGYFSNSPAHLELTASSPRFSPTLTAVNRIRSFTVTHHLNQAQNKDIQKFTWPLLQVCCNDATFIHSP